MYGDFFVFSSTLGPHRKVFFLHSIHKIHKYLCCSPATPYFLFWSLKRLYNSWCSFDKSTCLILYEKQPGESRCCFLHSWVTITTHPLPFPLALTLYYYHHFTLNMAPRKRYKVARKMSSNKTLYHYVRYEEHLESKERFSIKKYLLIIGKKKNMQVLSHTFTYFST